VIISHKYQFIFLKTLKTAGTSIEIFLSGHCGHEDIVTPIFPHVKPHFARNFQEGGFLDHIPALEIQRRISSDIWNNYHKFCVERNPWDKTLSHYYLLKFRANNNLSLDEYFAKKQFCLNYPIYTDRAGGTIVDKIIKYENLAHGLQTTFDMLGIPFSGSLGVHAKSEYRTDKRHYRDILSSEQANLISDVFSKEIQMHGYTY